MIVEKTLQIFTKMQFFNCTSSCEVEMLRTENFGPLHSPQPNFLSVPLTTSALRKKIGLKCCKWLDNMHCIVIFYHHMHFLSPFWT